MLTLNEKKKYVLSHKKDFKEHEKHTADEWNKSFKNIDNEINRIYKELNKIEKESGKPTTKKLSKAKTELLKPVKVDDKYLKQIYKNRSVCHKETVNGLDLRPYLEKIRRRKKEYELVLFIKNKRVVKELLLTSNNYSFVNVYKYMPKVISEAKKRKAQLYIVHNHPLVISAAPSLQDIKSFIVSTKKYKKEGIKILDFGVVTFDDYYSYKQQRRITNNILKIAKKDKIKNNWSLELIEATFLTRYLHILKRKKKFHPNFLHGKNKRKDINNSNDDYRKIKRIASSEVKKIIKKYPEYAI